ncbi:MAG TPA: NTP transferase domain-containing protein [Sphingomonadaceae bacterium]|nr:NTP transferase domain-containing protein [Sphingomonadaceae bacterium]
MKHKLAIAILAAGKADRFGGGKLDANLAGKRLGSYAVEAALPLGLPKIVVACPPPEFASEALACGEAQLLRNKRADEGLGTSVALAAMQASAAGAEALLLLLADMPQVSSGTLSKLVENCSPERPAAVEHHDGRAGIPACFPADWFPRLAGLTHDHGAGGLLNEATNVALVRVDPSELVDIDTQADLSALETRHRL